MTAVQDLFERIINGGFSIINCMLVEQWQESLILEFKQAENKSAPMTVIDKRNLAKEVGAFANSDGGVIVWGINASSSSPQEPDAAKSLEPISNIDVFLSNLETNAGQLVSPGVSGVEHRVIFDPNDSSRGYAITYVPRGEGEPHMSRGKEQHCFFYRSGSSSFKMESFMLADRYGRRPQPKLELNIHHETGYIPVGQNAGGIAIQFIFGIKNTGLGLAIYPALEIADHSMLKFHPFTVEGHHGSHLPRQPRVNRRMPHFFCGGADDPIHPGRTFEVCIFKVETTNEMPLDEPLPIKYKIFCQGFIEEGEELINLRRLVGR